ncbi:MAG: AAA-like domain-containing protein [Bacteroidales bacterium]|nr:AAA-like domain-containing protein [Bacteroidales bacterium]
MAKEFNTAVTCNPQRHYMVDVTSKMKVFERLINSGKYFTITYARQFGKSTSLNWILHNMSDNYLVIPISFESSASEDWNSTDNFCKYFCKKIIEPLGKISDYQSFWIDITNTEKLDYDILASKITEFCKHVSKKVVLTIDEVDKSLDNELFLRFLAMLRNMYLDREKFNDNNYTFWSVVLAGVYDVKSMKIKIRPDEEHKFNSPWNVAAEYELDMTFNPQEISTMLADYENDHHIGFNIKEISEEIYKYTSGYPVLVSRICKLIDESLNQEWTKEGVLKAVKKITKDTNSTILQTLTQNIENYPDLKRLLRAISLENFHINYYAKNFPIELGRTFAFLRPNEHSQAQIHNLIFQQVLYDYFIAENQINSLQQPAPFGVFVDKKGDLNMPMIINRFKDLVSQKHSKEDNFLEREGRFMFICFLKPIINGTGFYYSEPENDDSSRMDLVVTYNRKEYIIELKIWHGTEYEISGREQLSEYLTTRNLTEGYLVTFSFLKNKVVQPKPEWIEYNGKRIYEAVV